ncbi:hypothetical protein HMP0015_1191 [Acinetobacter haemolyticus ATCC 19194]|uniref:Uncharacterized protein n=1 Tax=Acinetobacter haemolyticus ATCC 19194 TaxID=707232 RepID=D4XN99_ACIHA|nr:hypothetical protein HMP0015_1191 [Acinetobacter haemolyticus ATCC 19194]
MIIAKVALKKRTFYRMNRSIKMKKYDDGLNFFIFCKVTNIF